MAYLNLISFFLVVLFHDFDQSFVSIATAVAFAAAAADAANDADDDAVATYLQPR